MRRVPAVAAAALSTALVIGQGLHGWVHAQPAKGAVEAEAAGHVHPGNGAPHLTKQAGDAAVRIEYIAHASFVVESPGGTRIALDPFNSNIWLGYSFPDGVEADAVLVTHPHYDHDATYHFDDLTPVFRAPGRYRVGDVELIGIESEHAGRARFLDRGQTPYNTIWVLETGGLRIGHLGDNRLLNEVDLAALGEVDVLMVNGNYFDAPNAEMLTLLLNEAAPRTLIPMHYRHHEISELPRGMRPVADYLEGRDARYVDGNTATFASGSPGDTPLITVLQPSPDVEPWPDRLHEAWIEANEGAGLLLDAEQERDEARAEEALWEGLFHYETAMDLAPGVLKFGYGAGRALALLGQVNDAIETLDHALARAPRADWTDRSRVHLLLGELYEQGDHPEIAVEHYETVVAQTHTHETEMRDRAASRLAELREQAASAAARESSRDDAPAATPGTPRGERAAPRRPE